MARVSKVQVATGTGDVQGYTGSGILMGYSFYESAGTPAVASLLLREGTSTAGAVVAAVEVALNASTTQWFGPQGIPFSTGIFVDRVTGETAGVLYIG